MGYIVQYQAHEDSGVRSVWMANAAANEGHRSTTNVCQTLFYYLYIRSIALGCEFVPGLGIWDAGVAARHVQYIPQIQILKLYNLESVIIVSS